MALTRNFKETIKARAERDQAFRKELLREAVERLLGGELDAGKSLLREYINATIGFRALAQSLDRPPKSLMRMLGPSGNPQARSLFEIVACLQEKEGVRFHVKASRAA